MIPLYDLHKLYLNCNYSSMIEESLVKADGLDETSKTSKEWNVYRVLQREVEIF